jgi:hypothetical protein
MEASAAGLGAVDSEGGLAGRTIQATEWAFPILTVRWRAGSTRTDSVRAGPAAAE